MRERAGSSRREWPGDLSRDRRRDGLPQHELAPDQQLILNWQRLAGNEAVCQALARQPVAQRQRPEPMKPRLPGFETLPSAVQKVVDRRRYRAWMVGDDAKGVPVTLVGIYRLLSSQGNAWQFIHTVDWVGMGTMDVHVSPSPAAFKRYMERQGFESKWVAATGKDLWGLRKVVQGVGMHIRGQPEDVVNVHVDLHPPTGVLSAIWHWVMDYGKMRKITHRPKTLKEALGP